MTHVKFPRIENSYQQKFIEKFLDEFPELEDEIYVILEKLHGSNLQVLFEPNKPWRVGKRTAFLAEGEKFFGIWDVLPEYEPIFERVQGHVNMGTYTLRLFGEFCGPGTQKGVDYGKRERIFFFGYMIDDELQPFAAFHILALRLGFREHLVPRLDLCKGLDKALAYDTDHPTLLNLVEGNTCEGVVIQPFKKVYTNAGGKRFLLKKKNEKFLEKAKEKKPPSLGDPEVQRLNAEFRLYITENRLQGIFSKYGEIEGPQQIGDYIRLLLNDAKEDFLQGHGDAFSKLDKGEQGQVTNVGKIVADMLKRYL
jgi:Rnl2 family RNA ligase